VGEKFKNFEYFLPEVLISARAMKAAMALVSPILAMREGASSEKIIIGTVKGDLHDIGKNLVGMMLEGAGFEIVDLGTDVSPQQFTSAVEENQAGLLCISALLTTTMPVMKDVIDLLKANELRQHVKVMIGGAPVTERYALDIGADGFAPEAASAVDTAKELLGAKATPLE
jgi:5-methyltetrahydrofolate--homocysteine methyltransferase